MLLHETRKNQTYWAWKKKSLFKEVDIGRRAASKWMLRITKIWNEIDAAYIFDVNLSSWEMCITTEFYF